MSGAGGVKPVAAVLAGGRSRRFRADSAATPKALAPLKGKPLIAHVVGRLAGQAGPLLLSVQVVDERLAFLGLEQVPDAERRQRGPLAGLCSAMRHVLAHGLGEWLLLAPCDAPFLPPDLAARLHAAARASGRPVSVAHYGDFLQPTFSLWHRQVFADVERMLAEQGGGGLRHMVERLPHASVDWPQRLPPPFFDVNTPGDLWQAEDLLDGAGTAD